MTKNEEIVKECDHFIGNYQESLPRVALRGLRPLLTLLLSMKKPPAEIFKCSIGLDNRRCIDGAESLVHARIVVLGLNGEDEFIFGAQWRPHAVMSSAFETALEDLGLGKDTYREITFESVIELGIAPWELASYVKKAADSNQFQLEAEKATQKMAQA
jgi:hypothetical protein